ncbi:MAG: asparagine synthase (glutamine-hydrolyzing) [Cytophaga sp.]|nr:asparagine synthase (glutamine-hydrolyzing) [Undibacterium sp.]
MCGFAGFIQNNVGQESMSAMMEGMLKSIRHRGPDDGGIWIDEQHGVALGHRRLSILDLSPAGHQPMESADGRLILVFNGEIYNHLDIRRLLEKSNLLPIRGWRGHSDTETLLACFSVWGVEKTLKLTVGMFALALWDKFEQSLTLARDRVGEKPLYYGWQNGVFLFASELKSLRVHPAFSGEIDWHASSTFLRLNYIPAPSSIYHEILKLLPGTFLKLTQANVKQRKCSEVIPYWSQVDIARHGMENPYTGTFADAVDELEILVRQAVQLQSVADVPVGAFLSGGIDSSTVVAMMKSATTSKVTTFSIGMPDVKFDESKHASAVAKHLGTNHVEFTIRPQDVLDLIPGLSDVWDEPFADSSQIPTYLVSKLAKQQVTVALSGDGGDEFFLGYGQYALYQKIWKTRYLGKLPWDFVFDALLPINKGFRASSLLRRAKLLVNAWRQNDVQALNRYWMDRYRQGKVPLMEQHGVKMLGFPVLGDAATTAGLCDAGSFLPDDILVKVDRAAMANSLETRAPLLDHRIIEFAYHLPIQYKLGNGIGKRVLREVLYRHVPRKIVDRPKMGFTIPLGGWLVNELRPWAENLLDQIPDDSDHFNKPMIDQMWREHLSGQCVHTEQLWGILSLLGFLKKQ